MVQLINQEVATVEVKAGQSESEGVSYTTNQDLRVHMEEDVRLIINVKLNYKTNIVEYRITIIATITMVDEIQYVVSTAG